MKHSKFMIVMLVLFSCIFPISSSSLAGDPESAYYDAANDRVFWFILVSDIHIDTVQGISNLEWIVSEGIDTINPSFIVAAGDLTDSTSENGVYGGPYKTEWEEYGDILSGIDENFYYDIPGNHDHYNDEYFDYYLNYSVQGNATGQPHVSWLREFPFGKYHFLGICTTGNGEPYSTWLAENDGYNAEVDSGELAFIEDELKNNSDADLTFVFGHHPLVKPVSSGLIDGASDLIALMDAYGVSMYGYGHTHNYIEGFFAQGMDNITGVLYLNVASLGKSAENHYVIIAVDCNGISVKPAKVDAWPVVMITAPLDRILGTSDNPYAYEVPHTELDSLRALVFDVNPVSSVQYQIDGIGDWYPMSQVEGTPVWEALWDNTDGAKTITVRAVGSTTQSDSIFLVPAEAVDSGGGGGGGCFISTAMNG